LDKKGGGMTLKIDIYSTMRNEIKLLPYFLRHYETFATRIIVWDDNSDDGTKEMLESHPLVTILPCKRLNGEDMNTLDDYAFVRDLWPQYETISRGKADWVMIADTDELVYHPNMVEKLEELTAKGVQKIFNYGYTMYHPEFPSTTGQIYEEVKLGWPDKWSKKTSTFNPAIYIRWSHGRHHVIGGRRIPTEFDTGINILHFRYLGKEYFLERNKKNCDGYHSTFNPNARHNLPDGTRGVHWVWYESSVPKLTNVVDIY
jgi:glycosyltransferase involved in cell wall biosynthesis